MDFAAPLVLAGVAAVGAVAMTMPRASPSQGMAVSARKADSISSTSEHAPKQEAWSEGLGFTTAQPSSSQKKKMLAPGTIKPSVEDNLFTKSRGASGLNMMVGSFKDPHLGAGPDDA